jgi:hypothetical protein
MNIKSKQRTFLAGLLLGVAGIINSHAQSSFVTISVDMGTNIANGTFNPGNGDSVVVVGSFNNWGPSALLSQEGSSTIYTNTVDDTNDANGTSINYKFQSDIGGVYAYEGTFGGNNRAVALPATSGGSVTAPTPFFSDDGAPVTNGVTFQVDMSQQINLGLFTNGSSTVVVSGAFNGWPGAASTNVLTWTPSILQTNQFGLVTSNVYTGTWPITASPNASSQYKFVENGNYESSPVNNASGNRYYYVLSATPTLVLPIVFYNDQPFAPICQVTFSVDMSAQLYFGTWTPSDGVFCQGINGNWSDVNQGLANATQMTNNPTAANTNIYYVTFPAGEGSSQQWKFTYNGTSGTVYEQPTSTGGNNRSLTVPTVSAYTVPTVLFSDQSINDLLISNVNVTFSVDMTHAVEYGTGIAFDPSTDVVYVNGAWIDWPAWTGIALQSYQLTNNPVGANPNVYSGTFEVPIGNSITMTYKYGINDGTDGIDNEAASGQNHVRIIRNFPTGSYALPTDTFGDQYNEPQFGELSVAPAPGGTVKLSWLGAPNVQVQTASTINGAWTTQSQTAGALWSSGVGSPNGFVSVTNWPAGGGGTFFRLLKQ